MKKHHKNRLRKLIAFLRELPPEKFDFTRVVSQVKSNGHVCGAVCCAMGWTPAVFPRLVGWAEDYLRERKASKSEGLQLKGEARSRFYGEVATELFGLTGATARNLFAPNEQRWISPDLENLGYYAKPAKVAAMLEKFLALVEAGKVQP